MFRIWATPLNRLLPRHSAVLVEPTTPSVAAVKHANGEEAPFLFVLVFSHLVPGRLAFAYVEVALNVKCDG